MRNRRKTEERIVHAATSLFARHGLHGVSVRSIAAEAEVNLSLISQYFGGKEALYATCMDMLYTELAGQLPNLLADLAQARHPRASMHSAITKLLQLGQVRRETVLLTMRHFVDSGGMDSNSRDALLVPTVRRITEHLKTHSYLEESQLRVSVLGVILLLGRFVALTGEDLAQVNLTPVHDDTTVNHLTDLAIRMLGLTVEKTWENHQTHKGMNIA